MYALPLRRWISLILVKLGPAHCGERCSVSIVVLILGDSKSNHAGAQVTS